MIENTILDLFKLHFPHLLQAEKKEVSAHFRKILKYQRFSLKIQKLNQDIEDYSELPHLAESWKWVKGLLFDLMQVKKEADKLRK